MDIRDPGKMINVHIDYITFLVTDPCTYMYDIVVHAFYLNVHNSINYVFLFYINRAPETGSYELKVEKSLMRLAIMNFGVISLSGPRGTVADTSDLTQKVETP